LKTSSRARKIDNLEKTYIIQRVIAKVEHVLRIMNNLSNKNKTQNLTVHKCCNTNELATILDIERKAKTAPWTEAMFQDSLAANYNFWTLKLNSEIIGFIVFNIAADESNILNICINPKYQRLGFGTLLVRKTLNHVNNIYLEVRASNTPAINFYNKLGFKKISVRKNYYKNEDAIILRGCCKLNL